MAPVAGVWASRSCPILPVAFGRFELGRSYPIVMLLMPFRTKLSSRPFIPPPADVGVRLGVPDAAEPWLYSAAYREMFCVKPTGKLAVEGTGDGVYERRSANDLAARKLLCGESPLRPGDPGMSRRLDPWRFNVW